MRWLSSSNERATFISNQRRKQDGTKKQHSKQPANRLRCGNIKATIWENAGEKGPFCFGDSPTIADLCLVPQLANARRFGVDVLAFPRLLKAEAAAKEMKAFADAAPDKQADAE